MFIVVDCEQVFGEISHSRLTSHVNLAKKSSVALNTGHTEASQALSANLLDSILGEHLPKAAYKEVTRKKGSRLDIDEYELQTALVLAPAWRAYARFWREEGDPIPYQFARNASAHAVSRRQYSRVNAVIALMLVASTLKLINEYL